MSDALTGVNEVKNGSLQRYKFGQFLRFRQVPSVFKVQNVVTPSAVQVTHVTRQTGSNTLEAVFIGGKKNSLEIHP